MLNHIYGKIIFIAKNYIILEANGLGYKLTIKDLQNAKVGDYKRLFVHCLIKTDNKNYINSEIFAFNSPIERNLFTQLISISGIGPIIANNIIECGYKNVIQYIVNENIDALMEIKGVNEKIARHIIAALLEPYLKLAESLNIDKNISHENDFVNAMKQLGYNNHEINYALKSVDKNLDLDEQIGKSIKIIALSHENS